MALLNANGMHGKHLRLGVQANPGEIGAAVRRKVEAWAPRVARSYTVFDFRLVDYHRRPVDVDLGYALFSVNYYSRADEGDERL